MTTAAEVACWPAAGERVAALELALGQGSVQEQAPGLVPGLVPEQGLAPAPVPGQARARALRPPEAPRIHLLRRRSL